MQSPTEDIQIESHRPLGRLIGDLKDDCVSLFRQEAQLAKLEMKENVSKATTLTVIVIAGGLGAFAGLIVMLMGIASLVAMAFGSGSGAIAAGQLIVGLAVAGGGGFAAYKAAKRLPSQALVPRQTIESLKADARNLKNELT